MLKGKRILLGVSGGIAIYKSLEVISRLNKTGSQVEVIMTKAAEEFISKMTFETMSRNRVYTDMFDRGIDHSEVSHISLSERADCFLIAPATANIIAKAANGIADDMLSTSILASDCPLIFAPAMNTRMLNNRTTQDNLKRLMDLGHKIISPTSGVLACNSCGDGRMEEPENIVKALDIFLEKKDLQGKKILISAGPTSERIDPVRYISNDSSGKMGYALAERAMMRGAHVTLVSGRVNLKPIDNIKNISVNTTEEMYEALYEHFDDCDCLIMAAAPSDYRPIKTSKNKIKKSGDNLNIEMTENIDILKALSKNKRGQTMIGFSAETENLEENARKKLDQKKLDYIVANDVTLEGAGFNVDTNISTIISRDRSIDYPQMDKKDLADIILDLIK